MARATRSKPKPKEPTPEPQVSTIKPLPASTSNPPKVFILPKDGSKDARIVTLDNPANGAPSKYYYCPDKGFYEFTRISAPKKECRSWLITSEGTPTSEEPQEGAIGSGFVTKSPDLFVATPIDLLFLILPALAPQNAKETKQHFLELDEYLDKLIATSQQWRVLLSDHASLRTMIEKRMRTVCDTVDAGSETMYRISHSKLATILLQKAERTVKNGLPPSLEEKFIKTALDIPIMNIKREDNGVIAQTPAEPNEEQTPNTTIPIANDPPSEIPQSTLTTPPHIPHLLRLRTSLTYMTSTYIPPLLRAPLTTHLASSPTHDFASLDTHLSAVASLKAECAALRSISDNFGRKRALDDDEGVAEREEKKRRKEEEEKKKKSEGRGIKALKKVDTSGMKKMSAFFAKVPAKKA